MILVPFNIRVKFYDYIEYVLNGFAMIMECAQGKVVAISIAESALLPLIIDFLVGKMLVVAQRIYKPYVSSELICWHNLRFYRLQRYITYEIKRHIFNFIV